ncbi:MAG: hypothetical protein LBM01_04080 [Christensenellaceae bacterium]|nr:hypothetical protein [Christensenellaceae bacterium]
MLSIIFSIVASITSGMILFLWQLSLRKKRDEDRNRVKREHEQNNLLFKTIKAIGELTVANSIALKSGKANGEMHKAMENYKSIDKEIYDFLLGNE